MVWVYFLLLKVTQTQGKQMMEAIRGSLALKQLFFFIATVLVDAFLSSSALRDEKPKYS